MLGEHTGATLRDLGYDDAAIEDLRRRRVIGGPPA
jgi:crotonobetainyl-CoA:carnitine CoA-transferase CaiB-like acyl-CoA transferase